MVAGGRRGVEEDGELVLHGDRVSVGEMTGVDGCTTI